jgi:hypothetical protein
MYNVEKEIRQMIVNIIKKYNEELLIHISEKFKLDKEVILNKYLVPYYYMPIIEREINILYIE